MEPSSPGSPAAVGSLQPPRAATRLQLAVGTLLPPGAAGYLVPVRFAFDLALVVKLVLAGSGTFILCRLLGIGIFSAAFAGTVYELSGAFSGWLGWSAAGVLALMGWVLAGVVLIFRGDRRGIPLLATAIAFSIYGGYPEASLFLLIALGLFTLTMILWRPGHTSHDEAAQRPGSGVFF